MNTMIGMFQEIAGALRAGETLPQAEVHWTRPAYTRKQMEALKELDWQMPEREIERRKRATIYPGYPGPRFRARDGSIRPIPVPRRAALA
jgi:hypothetical protein